jgi:FixJ family two-component response regulator
MTENSVIFIVDDDASVRTAIRRLLMSQDLPVRMFASAEQFLAQIDSSARGCLILDVRLPGMTGLQLQNQLVAQAWKLPVIIVSAHDEAEARDSALRMGAIAYVCKPFDRAELLASVHAAMASAES